MTDAAELSKLHQVLADQERQLWELDQAQNHGRWTAGGELVLVGDRGMFGDPQGDLSISGQVAAIDGEAATVRTVTGEVWRFAECVELTGRGRFPKDPGG